MRPEAITDVLCLLFLFYVYSQTSCPSGWFGDQCKYKCHCFNDTCDTTGECSEANKCMGGWFGPACQYADLAYTTMSDAAVVDGDESTCLTGTKTKVTIKFEENMPFTWLRATVTNQGSADLKYLRVSLSQGSNAACTNQRMQIVDSTTVDVHCDLLGVTDVVILEGNAVAYLCSVYISGGRNVALKENATQTGFHVGNYGNNVTIEYDADRALDGDTNPDFASGHTCSHTKQEPNDTRQPTWSVTLSQQRRVDRYVLYNRMGSIGTRLAGFKLLVFASPTKLVYELAGNLTENLLNYTVTQPPTNIQKLTVLANSSDRVLTLCEVEIYGDAVCDAQHYGRECELKCHCPFDEPCFVATGGCRLLCPAGFHGLNCSQLCDPGTFGIECRLACEGCDETGCDRMTGTCTKGCKSGFIGANCDKECDAGRFGDNCSLLCSPSCQASGDANVSPCDHETGACIKGCTSGFGKNCNFSCSSSCVTSQCNETTGACIAGCKGGFTGDNCDSKCGVGTFGENCTSSCSPNCKPPDDLTISPCNHETGACIKGCKSGLTGDDCSATLSTKEPNSGTFTELIVGLCTTVCALMFIGYFLCKKKQTQSLEEEAVGNLPSAAEDIAK